MRDIFHQGVMTVEAFVSSLLSSSCDNKKVHLSSVRGVERSSTLLWSQQAHCDVLYGGTYRFRRCTQISSAFVLRLLFPGFKLPPQQRGDLNVQKTDVGGGGV